MRSKYLGINVFKIRRKNQFWTFMLDTPLFLCLHHLDAKWENFFCPRVLSQIFRLCFKGQNALKVFWRQLRAKYPAESFMLDFSLIRHPSVYESRLDPGKRWKWLKILHCCNTQTHTDTHMCAGSCWCDLSRVREETRSLSVQSNHQVCIPPALQPWKQREKRKPGVQRFLSPFLSRYSGMVFLLLPIHGGGRSKVEIGYIFPSHLPSQWVKRRSMLWRVRKVQVSRGNSTLDGCGMGSHSRVMTLPAGGDAEPLPKGRMWPVQWRTWRKRARNLKQSSSTKHASNNRNKLLFLLNFMLLSCSELLLMKSIQFVLLCFCQC